MGHSDLEIARRAQYLVRSMEITWAEPEYSKEVRSILNRYSSLDENQRSNRVEKLGKLKDLDAVAALCRISRLDISEKLSKQAALANALHYRLAATPEFSEKIPAIIDRELGSSKRAGPMWLRVYRDSFTDMDQATKSWHDLVQQEMKTYALRPERTNRLIIQDLLRWEIDKLRSLDRQEDALTEMRNIITISNVSTAELADIATWLLDRQGYTVVEELAAYHSDNPKQPPEENKITGQFATTPSLLYLLAESHLMQKKLDSATEIAEQAFVFKADDYESHSFTAQNLRLRGLFRWSKREFRHVFESLDPLDIFVRASMAEMVHDQGDHAQAAEVLKPLVDAINDSKNPTLSRINPELLAGIKARYPFFLARAAQKKGDIETAKKHLRKAIEFDYQEADALIAIYKLSNDPDWNKFKEQSLKKAVAEFTRAVENYERSYRVFNKQWPGQDFFGSEKKEIAKGLNQYAWLVGNTQGDKQHAIRASHLSLVLYPNEGAYLDTLSHSYYGAGDLENAVKYQTEAVKQIPHSALIRQQYLFFVDEYNKQGGNVTPIDLLAKPDDNFPVEDVSTSDTSEEDAVTGNEKEGE